MRLGYGYEMERKRGNFGKAPSPVVKAQRSYLRHQLERSRAEIGSAEGAYVLREEA